METGIDGWCNTRRRQAADLIMQEDVTCALNKSTSHPEAVGLFHRNEDLQGAIDELLSSDSIGLSLGCSPAKPAVREKLGAKFKNISALADDPAVPRAAYVSPEAIGDAQGGLNRGIGLCRGSGRGRSRGGIRRGAHRIFTAVVLAADRRLLGSVLAKWLGNHHATYLQDQIDRGGLLLWVRTRGAADERAPLRFLSDIRAARSISMPCRGRLEFPLNLIIEASRSLSRHRNDERLSRPTST